jgi:hypothetical protein
MWRKKSSVRLLRDQKMVTESSITFTPCMEKVVPSSDTNTDEKLVDMKEEIMVKIEQKIICLIPFF